MSLATASLAFHMGTQLRKALLLMHTGCMNSQCPAEHVALQQRPRITCLHKLPFKPVRTGRM